MAAAIRRKSGRPKQRSILHNLDRPRGRLAAKLSGPRTPSICSSLAARASSSSSRNISRSQRTAPSFSSSTSTRASSRLARPRREDAPGGCRRRPRTARLRDPRQGHPGPGRRRMGSRLVGHGPETTRRHCPAEIPANMIIPSLQPRELVQLYRDGDVVVVPMFPNKYAGITSLIEGLACERPVVASRTRGLVDYLSPPDGISAVEPSDPDAMRQQSSDSSSTRRRPEFRPARDMNRSTGVTISSVTSRPSPAGSNRSEPAEEPAGQLPPDGARYPPYPNASAIG